MSVDAADGRRVVVTGANAGLGYFVTEQLARAGASVVMACRDPERAERAAAVVREHVPTARLEIVTADLADLGSIREAATVIRSGGHVDALVANAGVVGSRHRATTRDGFELQFGTNHLGHFALVAHLLPALEQAPAGRIVHLGSISHRWVRLDLDDPMMVTRYRNYVAYARSKLAVMTFGFDLDRRLRAAGSSVRSVVAHPGFALENLTEKRPGIVRRRRLPFPVRAILGSIAQGKDAGALPLVDAAIGARADGGDYDGPDGWFQLKGQPALVRAKPHAHNRKAAARLWTLSARLTRVQPLIG